VGALARRTAVRKRPPVRSYGPGILPVSLNYAADMTSNHSFEGYSQLPVFASPTTLSNGASAALCRRQAGTS
jgi:hypothetical protein